MLRRTSIAFCSAALFFVISGSALAADLTASAQPLPVSFANLPVDKAALAEDLFAAHHQRVVALEEVGELSRQRFDAIFTEFIGDLDRLLIPDQSADKSASDCAMACSLTQTATDDICDAATQAAIAKAACPSSVYAIDADYYSDTECQSSSLFTVTYACMGPSGKTQALAWLATAKSRSLKAWNNAWYAYSTDGCAQSQQTAYDASDAYVNFHNARYYMNSCS